MAAAFRDVEAATLARDGSPPITRTTFPTCRAHYPGGSGGCTCRLLPRSYSLPQMAGGSASALSLSRPAQALLTLRPAGLLNRLKAAFVTRLQPCRLPGRTARQLPDQSTTLWVESSSTSDPRLRGALSKKRHPAAEPGSVNPERYRRNKAGGKRRCRHATLQIHRPRRQHGDGLAAVGRGRRGHAGHRTRCRPETDPDDDVGSRSRRLQRTLGHPRQGECRYGNATRYSIVIQQSDRRSERWLYDDAGIVQVLSIWQTPVYRVSSPAEFNEFLGIRPP